MKENVRGCLNYTIIRSCFDFSFTNPKLLRLSLLLLASASWFQNVKALASASKLWLHDLKNQISNSAFWASTTENVTSFNFQIKWRKRVIFSQVTVTAYYCILNIIDALRDDSFIEDNGEQNVEEDRQSTGGETQVTVKMSRFVGFLTFLISALPPEVLFKCEYTFTIYGHLVKKATFKFLKDPLVTKLLGTMQQGGLIFAS